METTRDAARHQLEAQRRLGGSGRFETTCRMSQTLRQMALQRIRESHPHLDERGVQDQLLLEFYGFRRES